MLDGQGLKSAQKQHEAGVSPDGSRGRPAWRDEFLNE
jgi:hypothetical protein